MRTPKQTAEYMHEKYGKDAELHCTYSIIGNEGTAQQYWRDVLAEIDKLPTPPRKMGRPRKPIPDPRPTPGEMVQDIRDAIRALRIAVSEVSKRTDDLADRMITDKMRSNAREETGI